MTNKATLLHALRKWQPTAYNVRRAGRCHCKRGELVFYQLPNRDEQGHNGRIMGGFYCSMCDFGNAGSMHPDDYEQAERIDDV